MLYMTILLPEDVFINAFSRSIRCDTWHSNSSRHCTDELINCMHAERYRQQLYKEGTHMQFLHFVAFSNSNECNQIAKDASINASRKPMKVSEAVQETLQQQPAQNTQWSEMRICIFIANRGKKKKKVKQKTLPNPSAVTRSQPCRWGSKEERAKTQSITFIQTWGSAVGNWGRPQPSGPSHVEADEEVIKHRWENQPSVPCTRPTRYKFWNLPVKVECKFC